jgi:RNAse (barnase) inhibitor barstar
MARTLSEFHYSVHFIEGSSFAEVEKLHNELAFKLGLPSTYARNFDALLDCLSSVGASKGNLCSHFEWQSIKRLVLQIRGFSSETVDPRLVLAFAETVADANSALEEMGADNRIWIEYNATEDATS